MGWRSFPHGGLQPSFDKSTSPEKIDFHTMFSHVARVSPGSRKVRSPPIVGSSPLGRRGDCASLPVRGRDAAAPPVSAGAGFRV